MAKYQESAIVSGHTEVFHFFLSLTALQGLQRPTTVTSRLNPTLLRCGAALDKHELWEPFPVFFLAPMCPKTSVIHSSGNQILHFRSRSLAVFTLHRERSGRCFAVTI